VDVVLIVSHKNATTVCLCECQALEGGFISVVNPHVVVTTIDHTGTLALAVDTALDNDWDAGLMVEMHGFVGAQNKVRVRTNGKHTPPWVKKVLLQTGPVMVTLYEAICGARFRGRGDRAIGCITRNARIATVGTIMTILVRNISERLGNGVVSEKTLVTRKCLCITSRKRNCSSAC